MNIDKFKVSPTARYRRAALVLFLSIWVCSVGSGMLVLAAYSNTPGHKPQGSLSAWPSDSALEFLHDRKNLLVFVHPKCPCSRATLSELARLQAECVGCFETRFVFFIPRGEANAWADADLWRSARRLSRHECYYDEGGVESQRFGATTSGHVVLFGQAGSLLFSGGITSARGHEGDNLGRETIGKLSRDEPTRTNAVPVYGCEIQSLDITTCCKPPDDNE